MKDAPAPHSRMLEGMRFLLFVAGVLPLLGESLVIRNVTVIDATGAPAHPHTNVAVSGDRIVAIGPKAALNGARVVDGTGKFLIPGLWDMHVHLWESDPMFGLYVANGVTGIRDMGSELQRTLAWKREIQVRKRVGPRIFTSGPAIGPPVQEAGKLARIPVTDSYQAQRAVDSLDDDGADFVNILSGLPHDVYMAVAYRARLLRIPFEGHLPDSVTFAEAINARQRTIEHLFGMPLALSAAETEVRTERSDALAKNDPTAPANAREHSYDSLSENKAKELFQQAARYGTWQCPTLTLRERMALLNAEQLATDARLKYVPKKIVKTWEDPREQRKKRTIEELWASKKEYEKCLQIAQWIARSGSDLLAGTDTGDPYVLPGFALHDELKLLVDAGLTPMQAIQAATRNPARFFRLETTLGTVEKGKTADLVLLDADPLQDIRNTQKVDSVILRGRLFTRKDLEKLLAVQ